MTKKNRTIKFILSSLIVFIIFTTVLFSQPEKSQAFWPTWDVPNSIFQGSTSVSSGATSGSTGLVAIYDSQDLMIDIQRVGKEILRQAIIVIEHQLLSQITQSTVNWINSGFHGSPLFVQNPSQFFGNIGEMEVKNIINQTGFNPNTYPFGKAYDLNIINQYKNASNNDMQYSLSLVVNDPVLLNNYRTNFNSGGWGAFMLNTQYPQNNYLGYQFLANNQLSQQLAGTTQNLAQKANTLLSQGMGFLSPTMCPTNLGIPNADAYNKSMTNEFNPPAFNASAANEKDYSNIPDCIPACSNQAAMDNEQKNGLIVEQCIQEYGVCSNQAAIDAANAAGDAAYAADQAAFNSTSACIDPKTGKSALVATTPGAVVANQITSALNIKTGSAQLDAALGNSISAILNAFINHFLQEGLSGLTSAAQSIPNIPDNWTYNGQSLSSNTPSASQMVVPNNVTIGTTPPSNVTSTPISGGTPPYSIQGTCTDGTTVSQTTQTVCATLGMCTTSGSSSETTQANCPSGSNWSQTAKWAPSTTSPDSRVATANISGSTLTVTGVGGGQTSFIVQDSSSSPQTATVQVTTSLILDFNNPPATPNQTSFATSVGSSTNITLSGGTAPYNIQIEPDSSIALGLISANTLTIIGVAPGSTTIELQDSAGTTINLSIVIGTDTQLVASPAASVSTVNDAITGTSTATVTISGGTPPYSIVKESDPSSILGSALISGSTLNVITSANGSASITIQDSFSPTPGTLNISITAGSGPPADINFDAPVTQSVSIGVNSSKSLTMSGGSGPGTYSIESQSNPSVGSVSISKSNTITITGITAGSDTVVIQDSSSEATSSGPAASGAQNKTVTINITVGTGNTNNPSESGTCNFTISGRQITATMPQSNCVNSPLYGTWTAD